MSSLPCSSRYRCLRTFPLYRHRRSCHRSSSPRRLYLYRHRRHRCPHLYVLLCRLCHMISALGCPTHKDSGY